VGAVKGANHTRTKDLVKLSAMLIPAVSYLAHALAAAPPPPETIVATVDTTKVSEPISRHEYGKFIEHIGPLIYRSLWSEMLDDRKSYLPISSKDSESADRAPSGRSRMFQLRK
jgi:alpha-N-arabinofuranosidase